MAASTTTSAAATVRSLSSWITSTKFSLSTIKFRNPFPVPSISLKLSPSLLPSLLRTQEQSGFVTRSVAQDTAVEAVDSGHKGQDEEVNRRKLYVVNLPWDYSASDLENLFGPFGTVDEVEIIKQKNGKSRGFSFVTMSSPEEAQVSIEKLDSFELYGRIIRVQLAKSFKKPYSTISPTNASKGESRNCIYISNLAWKVRSDNLREFFADKFNPVSARVVFDGPSGRSAGYGFVSFATNEEAVDAISELDGKELMGRTLSLKISQKASATSEG